MIRLRDLLKESPKPKKGDKVIYRGAFDPEDGVIHKVSGPYAYCKFPKTHPHRFEPVPLSDLEPTDKKGIWKMIV